MFKKDLRQKLLEQRNLLSQETIEQKSTQIFNHLKARNFYQDSQNIMLYVTFGKEIITRYIVDDLLQHNKRVFIPVTVPKTKELIVSELLDFHHDLEVGHFGVLEPKKEALRPTDPSLLDLIIVPGVGFDPRGYRIGYGAGYYDRFLPTLSPQVPTVSLAFDLQIIPEVPADTYDVPVQYIITESQFIDCTSTLFSRF